MAKTKLNDIRIGTMVNVGMKSPEYIRQILPYKFESFCLSFWQTTAGIDWDRLAREMQEALGDSGAVISCIELFGNPLETGEKDLQSLKGLEQCIDHAHQFGCTVVGGFTGRIRNRPIHESLDAYKKVWSELGKRAQDKGIRIAFENCSMGGSWQSGDWNIAHNPKAWEMMFDAIPLDNFGLEWEPCHQLVALIDPMPQLRQWAPKIFHVHGKDATVYRDVIEKYGVFSSMPPDIALPNQITPVPPFAHHRTPGFGDSNWTGIFSELRKVGFKGAIDIEGWHDPVYRGELEMTGQVHGLNYLKRCRGGDYVGNPVV